MIIEELENKAPHILKMARDNLSEIKFGSHTVDEEIEQSTPEYLIAYAYRERGISIPDCVVLLSDYRRLQKINVVEWWNQIILLNGQQNDNHASFKMVVGIWKRKISLEKISEKFRFW